MLLLVHRVKITHFKCIGLTGRIVTDILNGKTTQWFCLNCVNSKSSSNESVRASISNVSSNAASSNILPTGQINRVKTKLKPKLKPTVNVNVRMKLPMKNYILYQSIM